MIRFAHDSDIVAIRSLWELCFPDESGFNDYFFDSVFDPAVTLLYLEGETLCAMLQMLPYTLRNEGREEAVTYIYGACTHPAHRRKHLMAQLLEHSFALDRQQGRAASILIPQEAWLFDFYRKFGYEPAFEVNQQLLHRGQTAAGVLRRINDPAPLVALYHKAMADKSLFIARDDRFWRTQIALFETLGAGVFGLYEGELLTAYALVWREADGLYAQELLADSDHSAAALAQALMHHFDSETLRLTAPNGDHPLGRIKRYDDKAAPMHGYMNLMLN